jgi:hypothetical protein
LLDGCPAEYPLLFERYFDPRDLVLVPLPAVGNQATFEKQIEILLAQEESDFVYFAEDDYVYLPNQFALMLRFLQEGRGVDFVSPYDHPDCYELSLHRQPKWVTVFGNRHWRTAASTCLTFLTRKSTLEKHKHTLRTYSKGNSDCAMWLSLTKERVYDLPALVRFVFRGEVSWKEIGKAWSFCASQILFGETVKLWVPLPGLATHLATGLFSPCIDFDAVMQAESAALQTENAANGISIGTFDPHR